MKKIIFLWFLCFGITIFSTLWAQVDEKEDLKNDNNKSKKERKNKKEPKEEKPKIDRKTERQLKKEMKEYYFDIEKYEFLKNNMARAKQKADSLNNELEHLKLQQEQNTEEIEKLASEKNKNQEVLKKLEEENRSTQKTAIPSEGVFFTVQIGAYIGLNLSPLLNDKEADLILEQDSSGLKKYLIGGYNSYEDAAEARKKIRKMGAKDAWIVVYKDGKRVSMSEIRDTPISEEELKELKSIK